MNTFSTKLPEGYKIYVTHFRRFEGSEYLRTRWDGKEEGLGAPLPNGGATEAFVLDAAGEPVATALAFCSGRDAYNKAIGRSIAIGRAVKQLDTKGVK